MNSKNLSKSSLTPSMTSHNPCSCTARVIFFLGIFCFLASCSKSGENAGSEKGKSKVVAKVFDKEVFASEIQDITGSAHKAEDSLKLVTRFLDQVALEKGLLQKAIGSGLVDMSDIEAKTSEFRNTLINLRFAREYVKKNLDSVVTHEQLKEYYEKHKTTFILEHDIIQAYYLALPLHTPKQEKLKEMMASDKPHDYQELKSQALRYANVFALDSKSWMKVPSIFMEKASALAAASKTRQIISLEKDEQLYLIRVFDYKFAKQQSPLAFEEENTRHVLLNKRKIELLHHLNEEVLDQAKKDNKIEIY